MWSRSAPIGVLTAALLAWPGAAAAQGVVDVELDGRLRPVALAALTRHAVPVDVRGAPATYEGVLLRDILIQAGVAFGEGLRGPALRRYVVIAGADGYRVVFALAELDSTFTDHVVLLADVRDGRRLDDREGPLQLVARDEKRPGRWVRQVVRIEVREAP